MGKVLAQASATVGKHPGIVTGKQIGRAHV